MPAAQLDGMALADRSMFGAVFSRTHFGLIPVAVAVVITVSLIGLIIGSPDDERLDRMLGSDEADYVRAMEYGLAANYLGTRERSGVAFVTEVWQEYQETGWARPFDRDWRGGDSSGLPVLMRTTDSLVSIVPKKLP